MKKICIIGGGIAGMASSLYLRRAGFEVIVCEKTAQFGQGGYAFLLLENGLSVLEDLGLLDATNKAGDAISNIILKNEQAITLSSSTIEDALCIKRTQLCALLSDNNLLTNHHFSHFIYDSQGFAREACFMNGKRIAADFFIGADGTNSAIRKLIDPQFHMPEVRIRELVSALKMPPPENNCLVKFQDSQGGLAAGYVPIGEDYVNWYIQFDSKTRGNHEYQDKQMLARRLIGHFPEPFSTFLRNTDFSQSHLWNTSNMHVLPKCHEKNILIIGDAAHTFTPFSSQGVNTALEDARSLFQSLTNFESLELALASYLKSRKSSLVAILEAGHIMMQDFLLSEKKAFIPLARPNSLKTESLCE